MTDESEMAFKQWYDTIDKPSFVLTEVQGREGPGTTLANILNPEAINKIYGGEEALGRAIFTRNVQDIPMLKADLQEAYDGTVDVIYSEHKRQKISAGKLVERFVDDCQAYLPVTVQSVTRHKETQELPPPHFIL